MSPPEKHRPSDIIEVSAIEPSWREEIWAHLTFRRVLVPLQFAWMVGAWMSLLGRPLVPVAVEGVSFSSESSILRLLCWLAIGLVVTGSTLAIRWSGVVAAAHALGALVQALLLFSLWYPGYQLVGSAILTAIIGGLPVGVTAIAARQEQFRRRGRLSSET